MTPCSKITRRGTALVALTLLPSIASAHHLMHGKTPSTFGEGLLSGLGHPVIGTDHFAFIVAAGLLAATGRNGVVLAIAFLLSSLLGTVLHLAAPGLPFAEALVSLSVIAVGVLLALRRRPGAGWFLALGSASGLAHGYAFGASVIGAEATPIGAYLIGLALVQLGIVAGVAFVGRRLVAHWQRTQSSSSLQPAGWVVAGMGIAWISNMALAALIPAGG